MTASILPGQRLREAREKAGLSEAEVARRLHMSTTFVRALEADDYDRLPEPAFIKGYLRNYARLLDLPADDLANLFQQMIAEDDFGTAVTPLAEPLEHRRQPWPLYLGAAVLAVIALFWLLPEVRDEAPVTAEGEISEPLAESDVPVVADTGPEEPAVAGEPVRNDAPVALPEEQTSQARAVAEDPEEPTAPVDRLVIVFSDDCWLKVEDAAGVTVYTGQKPAGSRLLAQGEAPFSITLGNAAAVESIAVNGQAVAVPAAAPGRVRTLRAP